MPMSNARSVASTQGIRVTVTSRFDSERSAPERGLWLFLYQVEIHNEGSVPLQLLDRHWVITNAAGRVKEVQGPGVVGKQPKLAPGQSFEYTSACPLDTPTGSMHGYYRMVDAQGDSFQARVGEFHLEAPFTVN